MYMCYIYIYDVWHSSFLIVSVSLNRVMNHVAICGVVWACDRVPTWMGYASNTQTHQSKPLLALGAKVFEYVICQSVITRC
jgi:hypothetical protein